MNNSFKINPFSTFKIKKWVILTQNSIISLRKNAINRNATDKNTAAKKHFYCSHSYSAVHQLQSGMAKKSTDGLLVYRLVGRREGVIFLYLGSFASPGRLFGGTRSVTLEMRQCSPVRVVKWWYIHQLKKKNEILEFYFFFFNFDIK